MKYFIRMVGMGILMMPLIFLVLIIQALLRPFFPKQIRIMSHWTLATLSHYLFWVSWTKVHVQGLENIPKEGCVFMANHQSSLDILLIYGYLKTPMAMIAKKSLSHVILVGSWMKSLGCYLIDTKDPAQAKQLFQKATRILKEDGYSVLIYPEGTRSRKAEMGPLKPGSMRLPLMAGCPIVPITISGSWKLMYGHKLLMPKKVDVVVHAPIDASHYTKENQNELLHKVEESIQSGFTKENQEYYLT